MDKEDFFDSLKDLGFPCDKEYDDNGDIFINLPDEETWRQTQVLLEDESLDLQDANADTGRADDHYDFCCENDYVLVTLQCYYTTAEEAAKYNLIIEDK